MYWRKKCIVSLSYLVELKHKVAWNGNTRVKYLQFILEHHTCEEMYSVTFTTVHYATVVSAPVSALVALSLPKASCGGDCCGLLRLPLPSVDWWIDCGAAASVSVPWAKASRLRVGIPAMASALGLLLWLSCRGPWGLVAPGAALTHILLSHPWRHSGTLLHTALWLAQAKWLSVESSNSTGKLPDCVKLLLMAAVCKGQQRKTT